MPRSNIGPFGPLRIEIPNTPVPGAIIDRERIKREQGTVPGYQPELPLYPEYGPDTGDAPAPASSNSWQMRTAVDRQRTVVK